jgi:TolB-like protein/cytochrome c-type biogenesis protein CcmH/NrfG
MHPMNSSGIGGEASRSNQLYRGFWLQFVVNLRQRAEMSFLGEIRRRKVLQVAAIYAVTAWLLVQIVATVESPLRLPDWVDTLVIVLLAVGFPLALILAWAYELTPEGLKRETDLDRSESTARQAGRKLDFIIIAVLVLALGYFVADKFLLESAPNGELAQTSVDKSIAVLPFVNMSPDPEQEFFSEGISEELLNVLSKIPDLRVSARTSSFQFKGENLDITEIGRQLNTAFVLEGSVRKAGSKLRITAQLVDASNGFHLWSDSYDRELENIFALQDEISASIVTALSEHLGFQVAAAPRAIATANVKAHEAYLRGRYLLAQGGDADYEEAARQFELALSLDPDYAVVHAELALAYLEPSRNSLERIAKATPHIERAIALEPTLAEAYAAKGYLLWGQENWEEALESFRRAVQINPNYVRAYVSMGNLLSWKLGRYDEAYQVRETAMRLDPLSIPTIVFYLQALIERNRIAEAREELEKIAAIFPHVYAYRRGTLESRGGNSASAVLGSLDALRLNPGYSQVRFGMTFRFAELGLDKEIFMITEHPNPYVMSLLGRPQDALTVAEARLSRDPDSVRARHNLGLALAGAGDYARARPILEDMWRLSGGVISNRSDVFQTISAAALIAIRRDAGEDAK